MQQLLWKDLEKTGKEIFGNILVDDSPVLWAKEVWNKLASFGITGYENDLERHLVIARFFALGTIYHEFYFLYSDEEPGIAYSDWCYTLSEDNQSISKFRLGQLLGSKFEVDEHLIEDELENELFLEALKTLTSQERIILGDVLINIFGDTSRLFLSLWSTVYNSRFGVFDYGEEDEKDDLNNVSPEKMRVYEWIDGGMPPVSDDVYVVGRRQSGRISDLISRGESDYVEFKMGINVNEKEQADGNMISNVLVAICAFMNSRGGTILIGVKDGTNEVIGVEREFSTVNKRKPGRDTYELFLRDKIKDKIQGAHVHRYFSIEFHNVNGRHICLIRVKPSRRPVYIENDYYIRDGNRKLKLDTNKAVAYIEERAASTD